jgi:hypothetical protein
MKKYFIIPLILALLPLPAQAQWPTTPENPLVISNFLGNQYNPQCHRFPNGNYLIVFGDETIPGNVYSIWYQVLDQYGNNLLPLNGQSLTASPYSNGSPRLIPTTNGEVIVIFIDDRFCQDEYDVFAQRLDCQGNRL